MRHSIKEFAAICAQYLPLTEPIYEFGALQVAGQEDFADLRPLFPNKSFVGCDFRAGLGVDLVLDLREIALPDETAGSILSFDTLEHVENPFQAISEMYRVLKPGGLLVISSVMDFPIHDYPSDYWRYTPEAFKTILAPFPTMLVDYAGLDEFPHTVIGIGIKGEMLSLSTFQVALEEWKTRWHYEFNEKSYTKTLHEYQSLRQEYERVCVYVREVETAYQNAIAELDKISQERQKTSDYIKQIEINYQNSLIELNNLKKVR